MMNTAMDVNTMNTACAESGTTEKSNTTTNKCRRLTCIITSRTLLAAKEYYEKKIQRAGSEEKLHSTYICKEAKDLLLRGYSVEEIRKALNSTIETPVSEEIITSIISQKLKGRVQIAKPQLSLHMETESDVLRFLESLKEA